MNDPTIDYKFCIQAFDSSPSSQSANRTRLGLISINLAKHNVSGTTTIIKNLLNNKKKVDDHTKAGLRDCLELYSDSITTLSKAARDYRATRINSANVKISSVMEASTTCEQGFKDVNVASPLTKNNNDTFQLCAIALSIMNMLY
ncbi:putative invertase inhibitor [Bienertia sinuspersici]